MIKLTARWAQVLDVISCLYLINALGILTQTIIIKMPPKKQLFWW